MLGLHHACNLLGGIRWQSDGAWRMKFISDEQNTARITSSYGVYLGRTLNKNPFLTWNFLEDDPANRVA